MSEELFNGCSVSHLKEQAKKLTKESVHIYHKHGIPRTKHYVQTHLVQYYPKEHSQWVKEALEEEGYTNVTIIFSDKLGWEPGLVSFRGPIYSCEIHAYL